MFESKHRYYIEGPIPSISTSSIIAQLANVYNMARYTVCMLHMAACLKGPAYYPYEARVRSDSVCRLDKHQ